MANNKVKFNLWNVHYSPLIENTIDKVKYGTPIPIPGAVSLSLDPTGENKAPYDDGIEFDIITKSIQSRFEQRFISVTKKVKIRATHNPRNML